MERIDTKVLDQLPPRDIAAVEFYKKDEITTDLNCCDVYVNAKVWTFHEDLQGWSALIEHLANLPGFKTDWYSQISQPTFAECRMIAYSRDRAQKR